jgi:hypothetical protein
MRVLPRVLIPLAHREKDLIEMLLPIEQKFKTDRDDPVRANERTLKLLATVSSFIIDIFKVLPNAQHPNMEMPLLHLINARTDIEDPSDTKSSTLVALPMRAKLRSDMDEATFTKFITESCCPNLANERNEILLPICRWSNADNLPPILISCATVRLRPTRA